MVHVAGDSGFIAWTNGVDTSIAAKLDSATASGTYASARVIIQGAGIDKTGATDSITAINALIASLPATGGTVYFPGGIYSCSAALVVPSNVRLVGEGRASEIRYTASSGNFVTLTSKQFVEFEALRFRMYAEGGSGTCFKVDNSFRCRWVNCTLDGKHFSDDSPTPVSNANQNGFEFRNNAGDNRIIGTDINNFGVGIRTSAIMNHITAGSIIGTCLIGVYGDAGSFAAGMTISDTVMTSPPTAGYCNFGIKIDVTANNWWCSNLWIEGADVAVQVGSGSNGPATFSLINGKLAGTTKCLDIQAGRQTCLVNVRFDPNGAATPTELTINSTNAADGFAANLQSSQSYEFASSAFPAAWTYFGRATRPADDWSKTILVTATAQAVTNWSSAAYDNTYPLSLQRASSGAQNATISWDVSLSAGTWAFTLGHQKGTNRGIFTVALDGTTVGTIDAYNGTPLSSNDTISGITVPYTGKHRVTLTMATKNASASSYFGTPSYLAFQRTT